MENNKKPQISSSSSLTSQLFGSQESSSSNDVLASIFPPSKGTGRNSAYSETRGSWQKDPSGNQTWNIKQDNTYKQGDAAYGSSGNKERGTVYQQEGGEPCYMSSSVYYGGREVYAKSSATQTSTSYPTLLMY
ncbi:uncharacterized protein [Spinacia oleracea]|uniref:Uncharacterized protein isoform X2 n=1 Tax=Spinacia oleracea TaxID=3562 RepID=A0ABM3R0V8_SPIOL|nr:uncharacterized protein LOC110803610 isoform X2 [Spinacia oleracea]